MTVQKKIKIEQKLLYVINYIKKRPFYNTYIAEPKIKLWKNIDLLFDLPLYEELSVVKTDKEFKGYAITCKVELIDKKDLLLQLEANKSSINDLFNDLLDETKYFKYQITVKFVLKKNTKTLKLNFPQFVSIRQQRQW